MSRTCDAAVINEYGPSLTAFVVVPLIGAFSIDIANSFVIRFMLN